MILLTKQYEAGNQQRQNFGSINFQVAGLKPAFIKNRSHKYPWREAEDHLKFAQCRILTHLSENFYS